jgi:riboflavin synthase
VRLTGLKAGQPFFAERVRFTYNSCVFTGIVEHQGTVESLERGANGARITVRAPELADGLKVAGSIAVNGCCLTVVERTSDGFAADLSPETLRRTTFGEMKTGTRVNLERPLGAGAELGGHFVQGHVDGVGRVVSLRRESMPSAAVGDLRGGGEANWWLEISLPEEVAAYVAEKGSLAVDGISLTVAAARNRRAGFAIIPYTYSHTNVRGLKKGDAVNLEADVLAKYVERLIVARESAKERGRRSAARRRSAKAKFKKLPKRKA